MTPRNAGDARGEADLKSHRGGGCHTIRPSAALSISSFSLGIARIPHTKNEHSELLPVIALVWILASVL